jgi:beta-lactamase superfamily II metal-dependent hydrolase
MGYEVDFIAVGQGSRNGDAFALRYGNLFGSRAEQAVVVIDGGTLDSAQQLVQSIRTHYQTNEVQFVVSTHLDADHASGLSVVLEQMDVKNLLLHRPWEHAGEIRSFFANGQITMANLAEKLKRSLQNVKDLETIANRKKIPITEPFAGVSTTDGAMLVLGPDEEYYESLICHFHRTPEAKESLIARAFAAASERLSRVLESWDHETLGEPEENATSPENNSSTILLFTVDNQRLLFTGDAGVPALTRAADFAALRGIPLDGSKLFQVPHHGSRRNVGPSILNRVKAASSFISCCADGAPKHPSQRVVNALSRRGSQVYPTKGRHIWERCQAPERPNWSTIQPAPLLAEFDE